MMRTIYLLAALLLASTTMAITISISLAQKELPSELVLPFPVAVGQEDTTCGGLWAKHGSVWNKRRLLHYSKGKTQKLHKYTLDFKAYVKGLQTLAHKVKSQTSGDKELSILNMGLDKVNNSTERCWNYMAKLRNYALCSICSADNYHYFVGFKASVSIEQCQVLMDHCNNHLDYILRIIASQNTLEKAVSQRKSTFIMGKPILQVTSLMVTALWRKLVEHKNAKEVSRKEKATAAICESVMKLREIPFMMQLTTLLQQKLRLAAQILKKPDNSRMCSPPSKDPKELKSNTQTWKQWT